MGASFTVRPERAALALPVKWTTSPVRARSVVLLISIPPVGFLTTLICKVSLTPSTSAVIVTLPAFRAVKL